MPGRDNAYALWTARAPTPYKNASLQTPHGRTIMLDLQWIRDNPEAFDHALKRRGEPPCAAAILDLDTERRSIQTTLQDLQARRNKSSKEIGQAKGAGDEARASQLQAEVAGLKGDLQDLEERQRAAAEALNERLAYLPNILADDVPDGATADDNPVLRHVGDPPSFDFDPLQHYELGERLGLMDFTTAATLSGARFVILRGALARLERALAQFMLDTHTQEHGYTEISPPLLVRDDAMYGTDKLPKFADDSFRTTDGYWLIPTSEVPLTFMAAGQLYNEAALPIRVTAWTACFRSEAGAAGTDTRGMIRQHQFYKVELVSVCHPDQSDAEQQRMTQCAETILQRLELPYRAVYLCTGDTGFGAARTYDLEVWLPGQNAYREISSCSTTRDFQARRMNARFRPDGGGGPQFVHTLNGSGVAVGRALIAVLENGQQADGSIIIPAALRPYMGGIERLEPAP